MTTEEADRVRTGVAGDMRAHAAVFLARAVRGDGDWRWHRRMHRALTRQAWNVQRVTVRRTPARPLSYRARP